MKNVFDLVHNISDNELKLIISEMRERLVQGFDTYETNDLIDKFVKQICEIRGESSIKTKLMIQDLLSIEAAYRWIDSDSKLNVVVTYGTDLISEIEKTLDTLATKGLVSYTKQPKIDSYEYQIEFFNAETAFLFGLSRPQKYFN